MAGHWLKLGAVVIALGAALAPAGAQAPPDAPAAQAAPAGDAAPANTAAPGYAPPPASLSGPRAKRPNRNVKSAPPPDQNPLISNYFLHLKKVLTEELAKPLPTPRQPGQNYTEPQTFPFDALDGLTSKDLMRAAREGARDAREKNYTKPKEEVELLVDANIRFVMEYYPLIAVDPDAYNNLYYVMEDPHAEFAFRKMLFEAAVPGRVTDTLFTRFLQDGMRHDSDRAFKIYGGVVMDERDTPVIRALAMENMYLTRVREFTEFLANDPNAKAFAEAHKRDPLPSDLKDPNGFKTAESSRVNLSKKLTGFVDLVGLFERLLQPTNTAPQELRDATIALLKRMEAEVPFEDPALIANALKGAAPASAAPAPPEEEALAF